MESWDTFFQAVSEFLPWSRTDEVLKASFLLDHWSQLAAVPIRYCPLPRGKLGMWAVWEIFVRSEAVIPARVGWIGHPELNGPNENAWKT